MSSIFVKIRDKHALWYKGFVFVFSVLFCTHFLPKQDFWKINQISIGDIWPNEDVVAGIDFLLEKSQDELSQEKANIRRPEISYFKKVDIDVASVLSQLKTSINASEKTLLIKAIDSLYHVGLCFDDAKFTIENAERFLVYGNEVEKLNTISLYNKEKARALFLSFHLSNALVDEVISNIKPNIIYDELLSTELKTNEEVESQIYKSKIRAGEILLRKNDVVTEQQYRIITSYNHALIEGQKQDSSYWLLIGQVLTCTLILGIMMLFLAFFRKAIFSQNTQVTFIFLIILAIVFISNVVNSYNSKYIYAVPYCLIPVLIRIFFDSRTALFNFLNIVLLCSFFTHDKFEFIFVQLIAGIGTIFSVADMGKRSKLFLSTLLILGFYIISFVSYHLVNNTLSVITDVKEYIPFLISSLCVLFSFPLIYLFEKIFGFTSDFTLLELCDLNSPLLRQLSQKVPGTFQHSLQVANLAEEACYKIGGNALLVRTGALYHDIGKMNNPRYFTENQVGEVSPHEDLNSEESAKIIINHVIQGVEKAKEYNLPEVIIDFIRTHHGTTTTRYFLYNYKKEHEGEAINEDLFRYPGPIPFSKETAILMMADGVEAASRSLKKYDAITIDELVDHIINYQINENQFINANITFKDITQIKKIFKKRLMNIYHVRIEYPR